METEITKIFLLYIHDVSYPELVGIFDSKEKAEEFYDEGYKPYNHQWRPVIRERILNQGYSRPMLHDGMNPVINII